MGFSIDSSIVRVDFFKSTGKWYTTEAIEWTGNYWVNDPLNPNTKGQLLIEAFAKSLRDHFKESKTLSEMDAVCIEPYHEHSHPVCIRSGKWNKVAYGGTEE
jgi:hypothetical protein